MWKNKLDSVKSDTEDAKFFISRLKKKIRDSINEDDISLCDNKLTICIHIAYDYSFVVSINEDFLYYKLSIDQEIWDIGNVDTFGVTIESKEKEDYQRIADFINVNCEMEPKKRF